MLINGDDPSLHPPVEGLTEAWPHQGSIIPATAVHFGLNEVRFDVTGDQPGIAVLSDSWHPGWAVTVDGQPAQSVRVGGVFRGVRVSGGQHTVHWTFQPWGWKIGKTLLLISIFVLLTPLIVARIRRKNLEATAQ